MKKAILLLNGEPYTEDIDAQGAYVMCCDGAYEWAHGKIKIDENLGDFDSLGYMPSPPPSKIYPSHKDLTDGEIAVHKLVESGFEELEIYGGCGGREDHFIGNLHIMFYAHTHGVKAKMFGSGSVMFFANERACLDGFCGKTFSVLPFGGDVHIMGSEGFAYPYPEKLTYGECRGISNVCLSDSAHLDICGGNALIIINRGTV